MGIFTGRLKPREQGQEKYLKLMVQVPVSHTVNAHTSDIPIWPF